MRYRRNSSQINKAVLIIVPVVLFIVAVIIIVSLSNSSRQTANATVGVEYIKTMEARDPAEIENAIFNSSRQKMLDDIQAQIDADPDYVWKALADINTVVMGDSRVVGFDVFEYMDPSHVLAQAGATIRLIPDNYAALQVLNPNLVLISYGMNDMNSYWLWTSLEEYIAELNETVSTLYEMLPNAYIYVQSIIPSETWTWEDNPKWAEVYDWNAAIKADCEEMGFRYLDVQSVIDEHADLFDLDGMHLQYAFYPYWANALLKQYLTDSIMGN